MLPLGGAQLVDSLAGNLMGIIDNAGAGRYGRSEGVVEDLTA